MYYLKNQTCIYLNALPHLLIHYIYKPQKEVQENPINIYEVVGVGDRSIRYDGI